MPVENIHRDGTLMFNKTPDDGVLADSNYSYFGDIHEDDEFNEDDLKKIKDKDSSMTKHWRYLTEAKANAKRKEREELEDESAEAEEGVTAEQLGDSTGTEDTKALKTAPDSK